MNHPNLKRLLQLAAIALIGTLLQSCGGGGGGGDGDGGGGDNNFSDNNLGESNPEFIAKAQAVSFSDIKLYGGHIEPGDRIFGELNVENLESGKLISVDVTFEAVGDIDDYSLTAQLVPQNIVDTLSQGETLGEIADGKASTLKIDGVINLGSVYVERIKPGLMNVIFHGKLPTLQQDEKYRVVVTPSLHYLSGGKKYSASDVNLVPVLIDDRILNINKLDSISVKIINLPELIDDNEFTLLETGGKFDAQGYAIEPIFQTSIKVDVTTFNKNEDVSLLLTWNHPSGISFPVGLLGSDADGNRLISNKTRFSVESSDASFVTLPVVAYAPIKTQTELLKQSTSIKNLADQDAVMGTFSLEVFYNDDGVETSTGSAYSFNIPLVRQNNSVVATAAKDVVRFTLLRAGSTNSACLRVLADVDTGKFFVDSTPVITATTCPNTSRDAFLWRYDSKSKQYIHMITDTEGNNFCITGFDFNSGFFFDTPRNYRLEKCAYKVDQGQPQIALDFQRFTLEGKKIRLEILPIYLDVIFSAAKTKTVKMEFDVALAEDFSTFSVDTDGRIFYAGKFIERTWGDTEDAAVKLSFGGETYADYMPVPGMTTQGHATFTGYILGQSADIFDARFAVKQYLPKKISISGNNSPDVEVENGSKLTIDVAGGFMAVDLGGLTKTTINETYSISDGTDAVFSNIPDIDDINRVIPVATIDQKFLRIDFIVVVIPVTIEAGIKGDVDFNVKLKTPGVGLDVAVVDNVVLSGYLKAKADLVVGSAGLDATIDVLEQKLTFAANGGFSSDFPSTTSLAFNVNSSLDATLNILRGTVEATYEYDFFFDSGKGTYLIYQSPYLFEDTWSIYNGKKSALGIPY